MELSLPAVENGHDNILGKMKREGENKGRVNRRCIGGHTRKVFHLVKYSDGTNFWSNRIVQEWSRMVKKKNAPLS